MLAHFQPLCAPTAFQPHFKVGCGSSGGGARITPTPCCRRVRPGGRSKALCVLRGAPGVASIVLGHKTSFSHGFRASCRCLAPHIGDTTPRPGASLAPAAARTMLVLRRAPGKVVFRVCFPRLETKISVRPLVRVRRSRSTKSPMGAKERAHAGAVHAQPLLRGAAWVGRDGGGTYCTPQGPCTPCPSCSGFPPNWPLKNVILCHLSCAKRFLRINFHFSRETFHN